MGVWCVCVCVFVNVYGSLTRWRLSQQLNTDRKLPLTHLLCHRGSMSNMDFLTAGWTLLTTSVWAESTSGSSLRSLTNNTASLLLIHVLVWFVSSYSAGSTVPTAFTHRWWGYNLCVSIPAAGSAALFVFCVAPELPKADLNPSNMFRNAARVKARFSCIQLSVLRQVLSGVKVGEERATTFSAWTSASRVWDFTVRSHWYQTEFRILSTFKMPGLRRVY